MTTNRTTAEVEALADAADVSYATMLRFLAQLPVRPRIRARCERALSVRTAKQRSKQQQQRRRAA